METLHMACPAKVNLHLRVVARRPDGYHEIVTLMQPLGFGDEVNLRLRGEGIRLICDDPRLPTGEENLAWRAARVYQDETGDRFGLEIRLIKRIPVGAGLGGGSSDAAAVLLGLNQMRGGRVSQERLAEWALRLGADVPFFILGGPALAMGIGERLEPARIVPHLRYVLVFPGWSVSTRWVYENFDLGLTKPSKNISIPRLLDRLEDVVDFLHNDLESVTARAYPWVSRAKKRLRDAGAMGTLMSGSGPTVFGVFPEEDGARKACETLPREAGETVWYSEGVG